MNLTLEDVRPLVGADLVDADDNKVGRIEDIYLDNQTQRPEWALVHTGLFGRKQVYVPLTNASTSEGKLRAAFSEDQIKHAPHIEPDEELTPDEEASLYEHYGVSSPASSSQDSPSQPQPFPTQAGPAPESDPASMPSPSRPSSGDDEVSDDRPHRVQRLAALLRERRRRLDHFLSLPLPTQAERHAWDADLYTYDDALVSVADLLDVEVPRGARDDLTPEVRAELERGLAAAGLDVRADAGQMDPRGR